MTGHGPDYVGWVPGRLEVFGTHTDYAGGRTLVSAVPRGFAFAAKQRTDGQLHVVDALASGESVLLDTRRLTPCTGWRHYVEIAVDRLARNFPGAALGADIAFASDLPRAAGMSSSSALIVGTAATLIRLSGLRDHPEWRANIRGPVDEAGYYACIENGRTFGFLAGNAGVGTHGGSEDHAAMVCGEPGAMTAFSFVPMRRLHSVRLPPDWEMVVATSGVAAEKTGAALEPYNRLAQGTAILLDIWNTHERPMGSLGAALASDPAAATHLETLARDGAGRRMVERGTSQPPASLLARRCAGRRGCRRTQRQRRRPIETGGRSLSGRIQHVARQSGRRNRHARPTCHGKWRVGLAQLRRRLRRQRVGGRRARIEFVCRTLARQLPQALPCAAVYGVRRAARSFIDGIHAVDELLSFPNQLLSSGESSGAEGNPDR